MKGRLLVGLLLIGSLGSSFGVAREALAQSVEAGEPDLPISQRVVLERGRQAYQAGRYGECARILGQVLSGDGGAKLSEAELIREARLYRAVCLMGQGEGDAADRELSLAIKEGPTLDPPDQRIFPPELVQRYIQLRVAMLQELERAEIERRRGELEAEQARARAEAQERYRIKSLEEYAEQQIHIRKNSRWLASVPFGVGQFQNREVGLGYSFLAVEGLLGAAAITGMVLELSLHRKAVETQAKGQTLDVDALNEDIRLVSDITNISAWSFLAVSVIGVIQAQIAFVPEHKDLRRVPLPDKLRPQAQAGTDTQAAAVSLSPWFAPEFSERGAGPSGPSGGLIGVGGQF